MNVVAYMGTGIGTGTERERVEKTGVNCLMNKGLNISRCRDRERAVRMARVNVRELRISFGAVKTLSLRFSVETNSKIEHYAAFMAWSEETVVLTFAKLKEPMLLREVESKSNAETFQWWVEIHIAGSWQSCHLAIAFNTEVRMIPCTDGLFNEILDKLEQVMQTIDF